MTQSADTVPILPEQQKSTSGLETPSPPLDDVLIVRGQSGVELFDLTVARRREAERRVAVMGILTRQALDKQQFRAHAQAHFLSESVLSTWQHAFRLYGLDGLLPQEWNPLSERSQGKVVARLAELGSSLAKQLAEGRGVTIDDITALALRHSWHAHKAERLVRRYQANGVWGLAPEYDPERVSRQREKPTQPDLAEASEQARSIAHEHYELIKDFLPRKHIPNKELRAYAKQKNVSLETLRKYLRDYRADGLKGLLPREQRADKGKRHAMSQRMEGIIAGLRFSQHDLPIRAVFERACQRAALLGEPEPTPWQVRQICDGIAEEVKEVADGRYGDYRSSHRMTYRYHFDGSVIVYQIDFTPVDVLLKDVRPRGFHTKSEETRAYLITCVECSSRLVMGYLFTYDVPCSSDIAKVLHMALTTSENKPYGGIPDAVWVDGGKQLVSKHMQQIAKDFGFELREGRPNFPEDRGDPQERGRVERPFRTFNTRLWATLEGYTGPNTKDRHPEVKGTLTISDIAAKFKEFLDKYHQEEHSATKQTPIAFWNEHCFPRLVPPGDITLLLQERFERTLSKGFIQYAGRQYWHDDLWEIPAEAKIVIRAQPDYMHPDDIQVIYQDRWVCPAFALDSEAGRRVGGKRVLIAQRRQRKKIQQEIDTKKAVLQEAEQQIMNQQSQGKGTPAAGAILEEVQQNVVSAPASSKKHSSSLAQTLPQSKVKSTSFSSSSKQARTAWDRVREARSRQKKQEGGQDD